MLEVISAKKPVGINHLPQTLLTEFLNINPVFHDPVSLRLEILQHLLELDQIPPVVEILVVQRDYT